MTSTDSRIITLTDGEWADMCERVSHLEVHVSTDEARVRTATRRACVHLACVAAGIILSIVFSTMLPLPVIVVCIADRLPETAREVADWLRDW